MVKVAVVGCGLMGIKIAGELAYHGHRVKMYDANIGSLNSAYERIEEDKRHLRQDGLLPQLNFIGQILFISSLEETVRDAEFVFEVVPEDLKIKQELFKNHIRNINDPEHPLTLEQLNVVEESRVKVQDSENMVVVEFTPTIPHCSMATLIGLCIRVKLLRTLPSRFKVDVIVSPGTHVSETAINKQLADKERVAAAIENTSLLTVLNQCLS